MTQNKEKKMENPKERTEAQDSVCQELSQVSIHRDTQTDLKTEKGGVSGNTTKKEENRKPRKKGTEGTILGECLSGVIASTH